MATFDRIEGTGRYEGWVTLRGWDPHEDFIGPFYHRFVDDKVRCGFYIDEKHINGGGAVHGGLLTSFADHAVFVIAQKELGEEISGVTISLNAEFCAAGVEGDLVEAIGEVVRATRSLAFVRGKHMVGDKVIMNFSAIIKKPSGN